MCIRDRCRVQNHLYIRCGTRYQFRATCAKNQTSNIRLFWELSSRLSSRRHNTHPTLPIRRVVGISESWFLFSRLMRNGAFWARTINSVYQRQKWIQFNCLLLKLIDVRLWFWSWDDRDGIFILRRRNSILSNWQNSKKLILRKIE